MTKQARSKTTGAGASLRTRSLKLWGIRTVSASTCRSEAGVALLITVLILFIVSLLGATIVSLGQVDLDLSGNYRASTTAFHLAESGLHSATADMRSDYTGDPTDNWVIDWINRGSGVMSVKNPFPDPTATTINGHGLTEASLSPNPYAGTPYALGDSTTLGGGTYSRIVWLPPTITTDAGVATVNFRVRSTGADANPATPSVSTIDGIISVELLDSSSSGAGMFLGSPDNGGDIIKGNRLQIAGSVLVTGDGGSRFRLRGRSKIVNNYDGIDDLSNGLGTLALKLPDLDAPDFNGESVETLNAVLRIKDAELRINGNASAGEADVEGDADKETLDAVYSDDPPPANGDVFADSVGAYDLDDSIAFPSLDAPYVDSNGVSYASFSSYLNSVAYTPGIGGDLIIDGDTPSFAYVDPAGKGSIRWNHITKVLTIDGVIKINGQAKLGKTGDEDDFEGGDEPEGGVLRAIKYAGTGAIWASDKIEIHTDIYPDGLYLEDGPDLDGLVDGNLGLIASTEIEIPKGYGDANTRIIASLFAEEKILAKEPANIAGSVTTGYFEAQGNDRVNLWQVPALSGFAAFGVPTNSGVLTLEASINDWFQRR